MKIAITSVMTLIVVLFVDYFWSLPIRNCKIPYTINTRDLARQYAFEYWRSNERRVLFGGTRYKNADAILKALEDDGRIEIDSYWSVLNAGYVWYVGGSIGKFSPEYYGFGVEFNRCGLVIKHEKVGNG